MGRTGLVSISGPLALFADGFRRELERLGYSPFTAEDQLRLMAHLSGWLEDGRLGVGELTAAQSAEFLAYRRACGHGHRCSPRALAPVLGFLRGLGVAPPAAPATVANATDRLLAGFEEYLLRDRGLVDVTVAGYRRVATSFLAGRFPDGELRLEQLTAADVSAFMLGQSACRRPGSLSTTVTGPRALLRLLFLRGYTPLSLAAVVPAGAERHRGVTPTLSAGEVGRMLASCDPRTGIGRRDYAILAVLARHPQRAAGSDPLAVRLRRAPASGARHHDRARARDPAQTWPKADRRVPTRRRDRRAARCVRSVALDRSPRPRAAADDAPDRPARLRADRP